MKEDTLARMESRTDRYDAADRSQVHQTRKAECQSEPKFVVPPNLVIAGTERITPDMLTLIELDHDQIDRIVQAVPGGTANVKEIYPLSPPQEGMLFHHLLDESTDAYVLSTLLEAQSRSRVDELIIGLQKVIDRHDILRSAVVWENLPQPVQVVYRRAEIPVEVLKLDRDREAVEQLKERTRTEFRQMNLGLAPLIRLKIAADPDGSRWYVLLQRHHIVFDHQSWSLVFSEAIACAQGREEELPAPEPYRNYVAWAHARAKEQDVEAFFMRKIRALKCSTVPFGFHDVHSDGTGIDEARYDVDPLLAETIREQARVFGVSVARLFHAAWALVVAHTTGLDDVVYGTVVSGAQRRKAGSQGRVGLFVNTLPLRLRLRDITARELVEQTHQELKDLVDYAHVSATLAQRCSADIEATPLFTAVLNFRHSSGHSLIDPKAECATASGVRVLAHHYRTNYPFMLVVDDLGEGFTLTAQTDRRVDPIRIATYMHRALQSIVRALSQESALPVLAWPIIPEDERRQLIETFNATRTHYPRDTSIHGLFEERAERTPDAVAVVYESTLVTYAELNLQANRLARQLLKQGVEVGEHVAILMPRSLRMLIAQLAILKCGAAYVPVDPSLPAERQLFMVQDCAARRVLVDGAEPVRKDDELVQWIDCSGVADEGMVLQEDNIKMHVKVPPPAYVMYTSGSTGAPKGVAVPHSAVIRLVINNGYAKIGPGDCVAHCSNPAFDASTFEVWGALLNGASVLIVAQSVLLDPARFGDVLKRHRVTVLWLTIGLFAQYAEILAPVFRSLRYLLTGGDIVEPETIKRVLRSGPPQNLLSAYGPTECTTFSTTQRILALDEDARSIPIGRPISNTQIYILDSYMQPAPIGVIGDIYIGGAGVALEYLNRADLTAERFLPNPFGEGRLYKSGDLGRWRADATIDFLGRNDRQMKIRGFRVELGEIEAHLARHHEVQEAAVIAREDSPGEKRLIAYVSGRHQNVLSADSLRAHLETTLPEYMIPSAFVVMKSLPLTPNGKVDRSVLPEPEVGAYVRQEFEAPQGPVEETLATIWQELLRVERVGRQDSFFSLGGHSLLVLKALFRINQIFDSGLSVRDVYRSPTLRELAVRICGRTADEDLVRLSEEAVLDDDIVALPGRCCTPAEAILLTGATGFVGRFLLARLLQDTSATVYCLVRAPSKYEAWLRLKATLVKWDLWSDECESRVVAVPGDLRLPRVGLDELTYQTLSKRIEAVYHCGTSMNHLETYAMAKQANVNSVRELLKFATANRIKLINYISTLSIFGSLGETLDRVVEETSPIDGEKHPRSSGYAASKWVGEKIFMLAGERGIPCNIFRLGLVWADSVRGRYDELQREYRVLKSCLLAGLGIQNYRYEMEPTPVDYVARAIVLLGSRPYEGRGIFHICSSNRSLDRLFERVNEIGNVSLELLPHYDWICEVQRLHQEGRSLPVVPLVEFAFTMDQESFYRHQQIRARNMRISGQRTQQELERAGIVSPVVDDDVLRTCVESMLLKDEELQSSFGGGPRLSGLHSSWLDRRMSRQ